MSGLTETTAHHKPPLARNAATRRERGLDAAIAIAAMRDRDLTVDERSALLDCYANPDRLFLDVATIHRVDIERLQELWFDIFLQPAGAAGKRHLRPSQQEERV